MEFVTYFLGDGASRDDGDRIVGRAEVGQGNQPGNAEFRAAPAADMGRNFSDNIRDASVETDDGQYAAGQQSDDDQFSHAGHAAAHGLEPGHEGEIPHADANQSRCKEPHGQNGHDVDSGQGRHQHEQIGKYFHPFNGDIRCGGSIRAGCSRPGPAERRGAPPLCWPGICPAWRSPAYGWRRSWCLK